MEIDTIYGVPADTWYALMVAARVDKEYGGSSDGPLWDLLDEIFGIEWRPG